MATIFEHLVEAPAETGNVTLPLRGSNNTNKTKKTGSKGWWDQPGFVLATLAASHLYMAL